MHLLAQEGGRIAASFRSFENQSLWVILAISLLALAVAYVLMRGVLAFPEGTPKMQEIARAIQIGSPLFRPQRHSRHWGLPAGDSVTGRDPDRSPSSCTGEIRWCGDPASRPRCETPTSEGDRRDVARRCGHRSAPLPPGRRCGRPGSNRRNRAKRRGASRCRDRAARSWRSAG